MYTDTNGALYFADNWNARVRKVDVAGAITTVVGGVCCALGDGGPATSANLNGPTGLAGDVAGNLFIADSNHHRIRKAFGVAAPSGPARLTITTTTMTAGVEGTAYTFTLQSSGGTGGKTWSLPSGGLPAGLSLNPNGQVTGTPTTVGTFAFTVQVQDSGVPAQTALGIVTIQIDVGAGSTLSFTGQPADTAKGASIDRKSVV